MRNTQQGFTSIELVVVIVILGILAAIAVPKFVSMQGDARFSVLQGVAASMQSTSAMVHAKALAANLTGATAVLPAGSIEGVTGTVALVNGYADASTMTVTANSLLNLQPLASFTSPAAGTIQITGATTLANCQVVYSNATVTAGVVTPPTIVTTGSATGCN